MNWTKWSGVMKLGFVAALITAPLGLAVPAQAWPVRLDPASCVTNPASPGCPITNPGDPRCNADPAAAGCMGGAPMGPADPRCIAMPTGVCAGGPYDPTR